MSPHADVPIVFAVVDEEGDPWVFAAREPATEFSLQLWGQDHVQSCAVHDSNPLAEDVS